MVYNRRDYLRVHIMAEHTVRTLECRRDHLSTQIVAGENCGGPGPPRFSPHLIHRHTPPCPTVPLYCL